MAQSIDYYKQQAGNQLSAQYAQQLQDLKNQYDQSKQSALDSGKQTQNNYNNQVLARGMGRSSIATTGLAGIENATNKNVTNLTTNYNQGVAGINTNRDSAVASLAQNLYNTDYEREWQQAQADEAKRRWEAEMAEQKRQFDAQQALALQQLQAQRAAAATKASSSSSSSSSGVRSITTGDIDSIVNSTIDTAKKREGLYSMLNDLKGMTSDQAVLLRTYAQKALERIRWDVEDTGVNNSSRRISGNAIY